MFSYKEFWEALKVQAQADSKFCAYFRVFMNKPCEEMANCILTSGAVSLSMNANMKQRYLWVQLLFENQDYRHCDYFVRNFDSISKLFPGETIELNRSVSPTAFGIKYTGIALTDTRRWYEYCEFFIKHAVLLQQMFDKCDCGYLRDEFPHAKFQAILDELNGVTHEEPEKAAEEAAVSNVAEEAVSETVGEEISSAEETAEEVKEEETDLQNDIQTVALEETPEEESGKVTKFFSRFMGKSKDSDESVQNKPADDRMEQESIAENELLASLGMLDFKNINENFTYEGKPRAKDKPIDMHGFKIYPRSVKTAANALARAHFMCELDEGHMTFIRRNSGKMYTEPLHLIPMVYSDNFDVSIDVEENIVSLCCNCRSQLMYGKSAEVMLTKLYNSRKDNLENAGIKITVEELLKMYNL